MGQGARRGPVAFHRDSRRGPERYPQAHQRQDDQVSFVAVEPTQRRELEMLQANQKSDEQKGPGVSPRGAVSL